MPKKHIKVNERGRRIGEDHPRAVLTDHEVALLLDFLTERDALVATLERQGCARSIIDASLTAAGLSYRCLALKFEVCARYIGRIANGERRCQTAMRTKPCP